MVPPKSVTRAAPGLPVVDHSDARLRALTEYALEIITVQDAAGAFTYVNEAVTRYLGYPVAELLGRNAAEFLHPDDADAMRERFRAVLASEITPEDLNRFEYRFRHRDGSWCWLESVAVNALGNPAVVGVIAHSRDISWRKANESILLLNHARYRTVADLSAGAVHEYTLNADGISQLEWALGTERVYGCGEEEFRRRGWKSFHVSEGWEEASIARMQRYLAGETVEFVVKIRRTDGQIRWVEVKNRPMAEPSTGKSRAWWAWWWTSLNASRRPMPCERANSAIAPWPSSPPASFTRRRSTTTAKPRWFGPARGSNHSSAAPSRN